MRSSRACAALVLPLVALVACSSTDGAVSGDCPSPASLVVGVEAEQGIAQRVRSYRVTAEIDGAVVARDLLSVTGARPMFPSELPVSASRAAQVKITVAGFDAPTTSKEPTPGEPAPVLVRTATTQLVCGERLLARMRLQNGCVSGGAGATGPSCNEPQTCIGGSCVDATIVRMILVPSTMALVGDPNWWLPSWLDRILPHLDLEGDPAPDRAVELDPAVTVPAGGAAR